jgi:hypothetical protein
MVALGKFQVKIKLFYPNIPGKTIKMKIIFSMGKGTKTVNDRYDAMEVNHFCAVKMLHVSCNLMPCCMIYATDGRFAYFTQ